MAGEAFTKEYELPNDMAYAETCASIGLVFFAKQMLKMSKNGKYADAMERELYNGIISGMQLDGKDVYKRQCLTRVRGKRIVIRCFALMRRQEFTDPDTIRLP